MKLGLVVGLLVLAACRTEAPPKPVPSRPPVTFPPGQDTCSGACEGLRRAGCREGFPTPDGAACEDVCANSDGTRAWPKACWAGASTRDEVLACGSTRCRPRS